MSHEFSEKYNQTIERLWEKLKYHQDIIDTDCISKPTSHSPWAELQEENPFVNKLVRQVEKEFDYGMSDNQCSMAILYFLNVDMDQYNEENNKSLYPKGPEIIEPERGYQEIQVSIGEKKLMAVYSEEGENSYKEQMLQGHYLLDLLADKFGNKLDKAGELVKEVIDELSEMNKNGELQPYKDKYYE